MKGAPVAPINLIASTPIPPTPIPPTVLPGGFQTLTSTQYLSDHYFLDIDAKLRK